MAKPGRGGIQAGLGHWAMAAGAERLSCTRGELDVRSTMVVAAGSSAVGCINRSAAMGAIGLEASGRIVLAPGRRSGEK